MGYSGSVKEPKHKHIKKNGKVVTEIDSSIGKWNKFWRKNGEWEHYLNIKQF
jgi:muconolactone delta-isomerase